jgi:hypothetical protein
MKLDKTKKTSGVITTSSLQETVDVCCDYVTNSVNNSITSCIIHDFLKYADVTPCHKKGSELDKGNYRPISLLPVVSKVLERVMYDQMDSFLQSKYSPLLCGFRKGYSTQHAILNLLQKWQKALDKGQSIGTILMDLSKAYDCLPHDLIIAKLEAYGFGKDSLKLIYNYLSNRKQRVKVGTKLSDWIKIILGVPQGSILGPLLFNIFLNDLFLFILETDICNFADDNTLHVGNKNQQKVISSLTRDTNRAIEWFRINGMVVNPAKFQLMFLGNGPQIVNLVVDGKTIISTDRVKLLGVTIDRDLSFKSHIDNICKSATSKTNALLRIRPYIDTEKARTLYNAYVASAFNYCNIIWMFSTKQSNDRINRAHKRALRIVYNEYDSSLEELLQIDGSTSIHKRNLRVLATEIYKSLNHLNPEFMWDLFSVRETKYSLRSGYCLKLPETNLKTYGTFGVLFRSCYIWNSLPVAIKDSVTLAEFKRQIKKWQPKNCGCRLCR